MRAGHTTTVGSSHYLFPDMNTMLPSQPFAFLDSVNLDTSLSEDSDSESDDSSKDDWESDSSDTLDGQSEYHHDDLPASRSLLSPT